MSHFLFIAGALRERTSHESAELQLHAGLWGLRTELIRDNLQKFLTPDSHGLVYVLKGGICAEFRIVSAVRPFSALDDLLKDEFNSESRYGFIRVEPIRRWNSSAPVSQAILQSVLHVPDQAEFSRRLGLGMHRLTEDEFGEITKALGTGI